MSVTGFINLVKVITRLIFCALISLLFSLIYSNSIPQGYNWKFTVPIVLFLATFLFHFLIEKIVRKLILSTPGSSLIRHEFEVTLLSTIASFIFIVGVIFSFFTWISNSFSLLSLLYSTMYIFIYISFLVITFYFAAKYFDKKDTVFSGSILIIGFLAILALIFVSAIFFGMRFLDSV